MEPTANGANSDEAAPETTGITAEESTKKKNPVRRLSLLLLVIVALLLIWHVAADRVAPATDEARVQAFVIPITPRVSGIVTEVHVAQDERVAAGHLLAVIDPEPYEIAVQRAEATLELAGQNIDAGVSSINMAQSRVVEARAQLRERKIHFNRIESLEAKKAASTAMLDRARRDRDQAQARLTSAKADLERARQQLGPKGQNNPKIRDALAALRQARIDLANTRLLAPEKGGITNLKIDLGYYANAGTPVMTFVSFDDIWIQANFRENSVFNIKPGDPVELVLDTAPGQIFQGTVFSTGFAVQQPTRADVGEAAEIRSSKGWLREAQRFPVIIHFEKSDFPRGYRRVGGQVKVQVYTQESNWLLNALGGLSIRVKSWLSYVY
jgi:multidrug resistance efflux pump